MVWKYGDDDGKWSKVITMLLGSGRSVEVSAVIVRRFFFRWDSFDHEVKKPEPGCYRLHNLLRFYELNT